MTALPEDKTIRDAYAAAYAGFRLAQTIRIAGLKEAIEAKSLSLLIAALDGNPAIQLESIAGLETILGFGRDTGHIHPLTAELLFAELARLKNNPAKEKNYPNVAESYDSAMQPTMLSREDLFPRGAEDAGESFFVGQNVNGNLSQVFLKSEENNNNNKKNGETVIEAADDREYLPVSQEAYLIRKSAILEKIRQSGNCRMRDLQEIAGNISERTLRYVLNRMMQEGLIERIGNSGPATYYRLREENGNSSASLAAA